MLEPYYYSKANAHSLAVRSSEIISRAGIVLAPTETQYGLCCNAESSDAILAVSRRKGKPLSEPMGLFVRNWQHATTLLVPQSPHVERFVSRFWPGPLTVVARSCRDPWAGVVSPEGKIGLRCSSHFMIDSILSASGRFLTATSANPHGIAPSADPDRLTNWFGDSVELYIFDRNIREDALPSTVVDITGDTPLILREGAISREALVEEWRTGR